MVGILVGVLFGALGTYVISEIPIQIRGIFKTDSFVVNWDISHYWVGILIASIFVGLASWIPARRAAKIEPAKLSEKLSNRVQNFNSKESKTHIHYGWKKSECT